MDGLEAIRKIKERSNGSSVKVIALSASAFDEDRTAVLASGADDFVRKPVTAEALLETIRTLTDVEYEYAEESPAASAAGPCKRTPTQPLGFASFKSPAASPKRPRHRPVHLPVPLRCSSFASEVF